MSQLNKSLLLCFTAGAFYALGLPSRWTFALFPLPLIGVFIVLYYLLSEKRLKNSLFQLVSFFFGANLIGFYWIPKTLSVFGQLPLIVGIILWLLFTLIVFPQWWAIWGLARFLQKETKLKRLLQLPLVLSFFLALCEYLFPQQFPAHLGQLWPIFPGSSGLAPIWGSVGYSFLLYWIVLESHFWWTQKKANKGSWVFISLLLFINFAIALIPNAQKEEQQFKARIVQANIGNFLKMESEKGEKLAINQVVQRYIDLSIGAAKFSPELIIWPETAYPFGLRSAQMTENQNAIPPEFLYIMDKTRAEFVVGGYDKNTVLPEKKLPWFRSEYNSSFHFSEGELQAVYHKNKLLPFGENLPLGPFTQYASRYLTNISYFAYADEGTLFNLKSGLKFISSICYEILFPSLLIKQINQLPEYPDFIINHTNDSWYGHTSEPYQHLFLSRWRALEFQIPIIRSTNTGISTVIYPTGQYDQKLGYEQMGALDINVKIRKGSPTLYSLLGIWSLCILWSLIAIVQLLFIQRKSLAQKIM